MRATLEFLRQTFLLAELLESTEHLLNGLTTTRLHTNSHEKNPSATRTTANTFAVSNTSVRALQWVRNAEPPI